MWTHKVLHAITTSSSSSRRRSLYLAKFNWRVVGPLELCQYNYDVWCWPKKSKPRGWYGLFVIIFVYVLLLLIWGHTILNHISYNTFIPLMIPSNPVLLATGLTLPASLCLLSWRVVFSGPTPTMGWLSVLLGGFRNRLPKPREKVKTCSGMVCLFSPGNADQRRFSGMEEIWRYRCRVLDLQRQILLSNTSLVSSNH